MWLRGDSFYGIWCKGHNRLAGLNSSLPSAAYKRQWTGSALFQLMACRLFGAKPLPEQMLAYCQLDSWEQISVKFEFEFYHFHPRKCMQNVVCKMSAILSRGSWLLTDAQYASHHLVAAAFHCIISWLQLQWWMNPNITANIDFNLSPLIPHYASVNRVSIGSDNGLSPFRRQAIIQTIAGLLSIGPLETNFSAIWFGILSFSFQTMHLAMPFAKMAAILTTGVWVKASWGWLVWIIYLAGVLLCFVVIWYRSSL